MSLVDLNNSPRGEAVDADQLRLLTRVAWLYHVRSLKQSEVASTLGLSQSRVSRLLDQAAAQGIVRTTVRVPAGLNLDLEHHLVEAYGLRGAHVFDAPAVIDERQLLTDLGQVLATYLAENPLVGDVIGFTSWSRTLRETVGNLESSSAYRASYVVEMLGDVGPPHLQHEAAEFTQRLARITGAKARFLRVPGVVSSSEVRQTILDNDAHARETLSLLDRVDEALVAIGTCTVDQPLMPGENFFSHDQFAAATQLGAVGQVNLRFLGSDGGAIDSDLNDMVIGVSYEQLASYERSIGVAGGPSKHAAVYGAITGGWVNTLITDTATAEYLLARA